MHIEMQSPCKFGSTIVNGTFLLKAYWNEEKGHNKFAREFSFEPKNLRDIVPFIDQLESNWNQLYENMIRYNITIPAGTLQDCFVTRIEKG